MMKFYLLVFGYKPSFDSDKGDKHKMEVAYIIQVNDNGNIGDAIPPPPAATRNNPAPVPVPIHNWLKTRTVEVRKCKTTKVDETLHTVDMFLIEQEISKMPWSDATYNFSHCLGNTAQMRFQKVKSKGTYQNTKQGFKRLIKDYIKELCLDEKMPRAP